MNGLSFLAKALILMGGSLLLFGVILLLVSAAGWRWKPLPGDIYIHKDNFTFLFPITTSILLSLLLTAIFTILSLIFRR